MDLEKTIEKARGELRRIQRSPEKTKKRYLVFLSSLAMIVVVGLWLFYLNLTLPQSPGGPASGEEIREEKTDSFFKTLGRGAGNIFEDLKNQFVNFKDDFSRVRQFTVEGGSAEFGPEEEPLRPTPLP